MPRPAGGVGLLAIGLLGVVGLVDLVWGVALGFSGSPQYGAIAEPGHLATCGLLLIALASVLRTRLSLAFVVAAAVASVAIDLDHVPNYLGWQGLTSGIPRPFPHSLITPALLFVVGWVAGGRTREIALGAAFGVCAHLFRDLAIGPGIALFWPASTAAVELPYVVFAMVLALATVVVVMRGAPIGSTRAPRWHDLRLPDLARAQARGGRASARP